MSLLYVVVFLHMHTSHYLHFVSARLKKLKDGHKAFCSRGVDPGVLWSIGSRKVGHDLVTKQQQCPRKKILFPKFVCSLKSEILSACHSHVSIFPLPMTSPNAFLSKFWNSQLLTLSNQFFKLLTLIFTHYPSVKISRIKAGCQLF